jgi:hypothetical protein
MQRRRRVYGFCQEPLCTIARMSERLMKLVVALIGHRLLSLSVLNDANRAD